MRTDTIAYQTERSCSFDQFLDALGHAPTASAPMMKPATDPLWIAVVHTMREQQDRIGKACLIVAITLFVMIAGRVAWAYAAGVL
ncbi:hypothetical protein QP179_10580 [Sphingomonas aurantiaca]|uniref:hypothetical protein n=1 Tax=Sphingomonas aurantiaca TaxID=185949 RepID=UPI002FDFADF6